MKKAIEVSFLVVAFASALVAQDPGWPRQVVKPQGTAVYYQPQVESWNNFEQLDWRMAFSITPTGGKETVGAVTLHGLTSVNSESQMVLISNLQIKNLYNSIPPPRVQPPVTSSTLRLPPHPLPTILRAARHKGCNRKRRIGRDASNPASATRSKDPAEAGAVVVAGADGKQSFPTKEKFI
jgi:hypothetical protein